MPAQLTHAIQTANTNQSLGTINAGDRDINLRAPSMLQTPADIAAARAQADAARAQFAKLSAAAAPSDIDIAKAGVESAQSQLSAAELNRDWATLHAPFDGILTVRNVDPGDDSAAANKGNIAFHYIVSSLVLKHNRW